MSPATASCSPRTPTSAGATPTATTRSGSGTGAPGTTTQITNTTGGSGNVGRPPRHQRRRHPHRLLLQPQHRRRQPRAEHPRCSCSGRTPRPSLRSLTSGGHVDQRVDQRRRHPGGRSPPTTDPTGDNPDHNIEIFRRTVGGSTIQLTETTDNRGNRHPALDADGSRVVFTSGDDIGGGEPQRQLRDLPLGRRPGARPSQITSTSPSEDQRVPHASTTAARSSRSSRRPTSPATTPTAPARSSGTARPPRPRRSSPTPWPGRASAPASATTGPGSRSSRTPTSAG